jgi:predicted nucleic acid-binding protein
LSEVVPDASVIAAALFREAHAEKADALLLRTESLSAPDLVYAEVGNVIWKRHGRGEITREEARELVSDVWRLPLAIAPTNDLLESALEIALATGRTVYDCLYVALAIERDGMLVTADRRLVNALASGELEPRVRALG